MWEIIVSGVLSGSLYALAGLGLVMIYRTTEVVNFAQGDIATIATFVGYVLLVTLHFPYMLALIIVLVTAFLFGYFLHSFVIKPIRNQPVLNVVIATLALSLIFNGLSGIIWGFDTKSMPAPFNTLAFTVGEVTITGSQLFASLFAYLLIIALIFFFQKSKFGIALRAVNQNSIGASFMGIDVARMHGISWGIAAAMGGIAGMFITPSLYLDPNILDNIMITAFAVVVLGGFSSIGGVILGGIALGVANNLIAVYISSQLSNVFTFLIILLILGLRPEGLLGGKSIRKF